jgi:hypothetical protein
MGDTGNDMFQRYLLAGGPHPAQRDALMTFGRFVGSWDMRVQFFDEAGELMWDGPAEWSFSWVLDGRAVQDVLVFPAVDGSLEPGKRGIGSTLRYLDPTTQTWRIVFVGAVSGTFITLTGRRSGDEIVLEGEDVDGSPLRWVFTDISADAFHWKGFISDDGGGSWRMEQEMLACRRSVR